LPEPIPTAHGFALIYVRCKFRWTKRRLARALGWKDPSILTRYERGKLELSRPTLLTILAPFPLEDPELTVDALVFAYKLIFPEWPEEPASPTALTVEEREAINHAALRAGLAAAQALYADWTRRKEAEKAEAARREAEARARL